MSGIVQRAVTFSVLLLSLWSTVVMARSQLLDDHRMGDSSEEAGEDQLRELLTASVTSCCQKENNMKSIGISDTTGEEIYIDVGRCRRRCSAKGKLKKNEFERILQDNRDVDPILLFQMHSSKRRGTPSCSFENETCRPSSSRIEQVTTNAGTVSVTVTEECECQSHPRSCRRQPNMVTLHKDTPLQTTIDVGDCQGHCYHELGCRATKTRSVSVEGPNGAECLSVIEECACEAPCYRKSLFEHVYNYSNSDDPRIEIIDVGTCIGECDLVHNNHCILRESNGGCKMSLTRGSSRCAPSVVEEVQVIQKNGSVRTLAKVTECGCH